MTSEAGRTADADRS